MFCSGFPGHATMSANLPASRVPVRSDGHGSFLDDEALNMMKQRGTYYVPTLMAAQGLKERLEDAYLPPAVATKARLAMAAPYAKRSRKE